MLALSTADDAIRSRHFESGFSENEVKKLFQTISKIITERDDGLRQLMIKRLKSQGEIGKYI